MAIVTIPAALCEHTGGQRQVTVQASTVAGVIAALDRQHPGLGGVLVDAAGVRRFVSIYVGDEDIRFLDGLGTAVAEGDEVSIHSAIAGG